MTWVTLSVDGMVERHDGKPSLEQLQKAVGGYIEAVDIEFMGRRLTMFISGNGLLYSLPENAIASLLAMDTLRARDYIVGDVVFTGPPDRYGNSKTVPDDLADALVTMTGRVVRVFLNEDQSGEHWMGYKPGHPLRQAIQYVMPNALTELQIAEEAFREFNIGDGRLAKTYRANRNRSLSMGDVICVSGKWFACAMVGWEPIEKPVGA